MNWLQFMFELSKYKYGVQCYQASAGQFSLNCAYFGIPCIGNIKVDTQRICHKLLSVDVDDVESAVKLAKKLKEDSDFYTHCSDTAKIRYKKYYSESVWKKKMMEILNGKN